MLNYFLLITIFFPFRLNSIVKIPKIAQTVCWYNNHWQKKEDEQPDNNLYIQFGSKGAFTDFHINYGGTSVWFHVYKVKKIKKIKLTFHNFLKF